MKILHVTDLGKSSLSGISEVISHLVKAQQNIYNDVRICLLNNNSNGINSVYTIIKNKKSFRKYILNFFPDIVIFHSLYKLKYIILSKLLLKLDIPYLILFHGGATRQNYQKSHLKKRIANLLLFNSFVKGANLLIYLNEAEYVNSIFNSINSHYEIIPNGIDMPVCQYKQIDKNKKINIIYISRIDINHKGLDFLFNSIDCLRESELKDKIQFSFYGYGKQKDIDFLFKKHDDFVKYFGVALDNKKDIAYKSADIFILTSRYEGMPIAILEALSYGIPCIVTPQTNMAKLIKDNNAGWITELNHTEIANTIKMAINDYKINSKSYFINCRNAVRSYTWTNIAKKSIDIYQKVIDINQLNKNTKIE